MMSVFHASPRILQEAKKARFKPIFPLQILIFIGVFLASSLIQGIPIAIYTIIAETMAVINGELVPTDLAAVTDFTVKLQDKLVLPSLFLTCMITILVIVYCRFIEKRSLYSMGLIRDKAFQDYGFGLLVGMVMFSLCVVISCLSGSLKYNGFVLGNGLLPLIGFFVGFFIQGMSEEVMLRGYLMISIASRSSILLAVLANSLVFTLMHLLNHGITVLAIVNLTLFGLFTSIYTLKMNSLWGVCAIHSIWNFAQGNIFGIRVSGMNAQVSLLSFQPVSTDTLINGGAFGLEGGLAVTIVLIAGIIIALRIKGRGLVDVAEPSADEMTESAASL